MTPWCIRKMTKHQSLGCPEFTVTCEKLLLHLFYIMPLWTRIYWKLKYQGYFFHRILSDTRNCWYTTIRVKTIKKRKKKKSSVIVWYVPSCSVMFNSATSWAVILQALRSLGFFQARILEQVTMPSSRESSQPRDWTRFSCDSSIGRKILYYWATWEANSVI